ncbi:MAG: hypothetical protein AAF358_00200 [Pseudomonadota bacterium]
MAVAINHDASDASAKLTNPLRDLNDISQMLMLLRPELFNHATPLFRRHPELLQREIQVHPDLAQHGDKLLSRQDTLPLLSTSGEFGVEYCFQIAELQLDPHPRVQPALLEPNAQPCQLGLVIRISGSVMCAPAEGSDAAQQPHGFTLDLFATACASWIGPSHQRQLSIALGALEIADVDSDTVSSSDSGSACYVLTTLKVGMLPRIRMALESMAFELGQFATEVVAPAATPSWARLPFTPATSARESVALN